MDFQIHFSPLRAVSMLGRSSSMTAPRPRVASLLEGVMTPSRPFCTVLGVFDLEWTKSQTFSGTLLIRAGPFVVGV